MNTYEVMIITEEKTVIFCLLNEDQLRDIDQRIGGKGLPEGGAVVIRMDDNREVIATDILCKYMVVNHGNP